MEEDMFRWKTFLRHPVTFSQPYFDPFFQRVESLYRRGRDDPGIAASELLDVFLYFYKDGTIKYGGTGTVSDLPGAI